MKGVDGREGSIFSLNFIQPHDFNRPFGSAHCLSENTHTPQTFKEPASECVNSRGILVGEGPSLGIGTLLLLWSLQQHCCTPCWLWDALCLHETLLRSSCTETLRGSFGFCKGWEWHADQTRQCSLQPSLPLLTHKEPRPQLLLDPRWSHEPSCRWLSHSSSPFSGALM